MVDRFTINDANTLVADAAELRAQWDRWQQRDAGFAPSSSAVRWLTSAADAAREVIALHAELDALRSIIDGRTTPPTDEEVDAILAAGGEWLVRGAGLTVVLESRGTILYWRANYRDARWWALDAQRRPCAWPTEAHRG